MAGEIEKLSGLAGALGPIGMGVSIAGQIFGAVKGANEAKKNQQLLNKKQEENQADFNLNANRSFLETNAAKDAVKVQKESLEDNQKAVAGRSAITGASDEAIVAANSKVQENYNDGISGIAAAGTQHQANEKRMYLARKDGLDNQQSQINAQKQESASNLMGNASDLLRGVTFGEGMKGGVSKVAGIGRTSEQSNALNKIANSTPPTNNTISLPKASYWGDGVADNSIKNRQGN